MKPLQDRLDDQLEQIRVRSGPARHRLSGFTRFEPGAKYDPEIEFLAILARNLKNAPAIQVNPVFARQTERRVIRRFAELRLRKKAAKLTFLALFRAHPVFAGILGLCLLLVLSTGTLVYAAQVSNPASPLYGLKQLEHHFQLSLANDPGKQASLDLQFARDSLNTLPSLANQEHSADYRDALLDFEQQVQTTISAVKRLPAGAQQQQLAAQLASLQGDAVRVLRGLLPKLDIPARLTTTDVLAFLGEPVPHLTSGVLTIPLHTGQNATVRLAGANLPTGARLLVDGKSVDAIGSVQDGQLFFSLPNWEGRRHPRSLGLLSPDGTASQTTAITINTSNGTGNNGNGNSNNGNSNKPKNTPTPHH